MLNQSIFYYYHSLIMVTSLYKILALSLAFAGLEQVQAACEPEIPFPVPKYGEATLHSTFDTIDSNLEKAINAGTFTGTSFSLAISSSNKTLHTKYHFDKSLGGSPINASSVYRVASNTKAFTALGIIRLEAAGKLSLDDEVTYYVPELLNGNSGISWRGITIRSLLSHSSGLQDNCTSRCGIFQSLMLTCFADGEEDLLLALADPSIVGLPPIDALQAKSIPKCGAYSKYKVPCTDDGRSMNYVYIAEIILGD
jgi:hypothetical protein